MTTHNSTLIDRLAIASRAVAALDGLRLSVESLDLNTARPRIRVSECRACRQLEGAWYRRRITAAGLTDTMAAAFRGCQVEWDRRGDMP